MGTSCGQGVSIEHSMMRFFLSVVLAGAALADSEPYTIGQVAHGYGHGIITGVDYGHGLVSGYGAIGNRGYYGGYAGYGSIHHGFYGKREADSDSDAYTIGQVATGHAYGVVTGVDYGHGLVSGYGLVTVAMLAMEVSMVATEVTMASVRLTLMPTLLAKLPSAFLWPMLTLLAILIMLESSLESVTPDTEVMLDTEVTIMDSMASVRLTLMPTPLARLPTASQWQMPTLLAILTMSELSPELDIPDTEVMLDTEVTLDTSTDKCLQGHCPATYLLNDFTCFLLNKNYK